MWNLVQVFEYYWNLIQVFECNVKENICTSPIYKPESLTNTKLGFNPGKLARLYKDLWAFEHLDSIDGEIGGCIRTCNPVSALIPMVGRWGGQGYIRICGPMRALNQMVKKPTRLHRDL
jgi:hypothetical protein